MRAESGEFTPHLGRISLSHYLGAIYQQPAATLKYKTHFQIHLPHSDYSRQDSERLNYCFLQGCLFLRPVTRQPPSPPSHPIPLVSNGPPWARRHIFQTRRRVASGGWGGVWCVGFSSLLSYCLVFSVANAILFWKGPPVSSFFVCFFTYCSPLKNML